jgi:hypothetical protein
MKARSTCLTFLLILILNSCEEKEEVVKTYIYINSSSLFSEPPPLHMFSTDHGGIYVDDPTKPGLLTSLSFETDGGETYTVKLSDVYNLYSTSGAGSTEPIEIPNREFVKMSISVSKAITSVRYSQGGSGDYTILAQAPFSGEFDIRQGGLWQVNTMENYSPFTSPSGKTYNGLVRRVELSSYTRISVNDKKDENSYEYRPDLDAMIMNSDKQTSCLDGTWERSICGGSKKAVVTFSNGSGTFRDEDCSGVCSSPGRLFAFNYTIRSDSEMEVTYTAGLICGQPNIPNGGVQPYSCDGNTLMFGNTYTRRN